MYWQDNPEGGGIDGREGRPPGLKSRACAALREAQLYGYVDSESVTQGELTLTLPSHLQSSFVAERIVSSLRHAGLWANEHPSHLVVHAQDLGPGGTRLGRTPAGAEEE